MKKAAGLQISAGKILYIYKVGDLALGHVFKQYQMQLLVE